MTVLQICPPHLSDAATLPWEVKKVIFNSIIHTHFWLFMLSHKKTNCNPLAHPTWKCHHTNLWITKLFHQTVGLLRSFRRWRLWKEPVKLWVVVGGSEKNRLWCVTVGMSGKQWNLCNSYSSRNMARFNVHLYVTRTGHTIGLRYEMLF